MRPHAVASIAGTANLVVNPTYTYDANGNMTGGGGRTITYTVFNKPATIVEGLNTLSFSHDTEHARYKQVAPEGTTLYLNGGGIAVEKVTSSLGVVQWNNYLSAGGETIGAYYERPASSNFTRYFHKDHLGSTAALTDESGTVVERDGYDAWGKRRNLNGTDDPNNTLSSQTTHGFGQEHLQDVALIHFNGRVYDPQLGNFTSADPQVESPYGTQGWNRYSYVGNNPLSFTDPTGYCFLGCFWKPIFKSPIFRAVAAIAVAATMQYYALPALEFSAGLSASTTSFGIAQAGLTGINAGIAGAAAGAVATGTLKGAALGALSAELFVGVGDLKGALGVENGSLGSIALHGLAGGASSAIGGGSFKSGFLSAGFADFAGPLIQTDNSAFATSLHAVAGGLGSVLGGGKFENGAVTGAFRYLFSGAAQSAANGQNPLSGLADLAGKIWALPDTAIGLLGGIAGLPFGASIGFENNAIVFNNYPFGPGGAITFGNVILNTAPSLDPLVPTYAAGLNPLVGGNYSQSDLVRLGNHEEGHTFQYQALGPFFLPVYGITGIGRQISPLESAADRYGQTGKGWWPW